MDTLSIEITNLRAIDGVIFEANRAGLTPDVYARQQMEALGLRAADDNRIGVITSAAFIARFSPSEYAAILAACEPVLVPSPTDPTAEEAAQITAAQLHNDLADAIADLIDQLTNTPNVALDDDRLQSGLRLLLMAGLIAPERTEALLSYERPVPVVAP
jgi:hypothetical protein